jgi:hypothetical protein
MNLIYPEQRVEGIVLQRTRADIVLDTIKFRVKSYINQRRKACSRGAHVFYECVLSDFAYHYWPCCSFIADTNLLLQR